MANAFLFTAGRQGYDSHAYHYGYVYYTVTDSPTSVTVTLNSVGERMTVDNDYYSSYSYSGTSTVTGSIDGKTITASHTGTRRCTSRDTYISFGGTPVTATFAKGTSATTKTLNISWTWYGTTSTNSVSITVDALQSYTVSYNANGGTGAPSSQTKYYGIALTLRTGTPTRTGYAFQGWGVSANDTSVDYSAGGSYKNNASVTLYAIWKKDITLSYSLNGGSGGPASETKSVYNATTSAKFTIPSDVPTKTNYRFTGWSDGTSIYQPSAQITLSANTTLTAQWEQDYIPPTFGNISAYRTNSSGTDNNGTGSYGKLEFTWTDGSLAGTSLTTTVTAKYRQHGTTSWTNITNASSTQNTFYAVFGGSLPTDDQYLFADDQYDILISLQNSGYPANEYATFISTELFTIDVNADGTAVGLLMIAPDNKTGVFAPDYKYDLSASDTTDPLVAEIISLGWTSIFS